MPSPPSLRILMLEPQYFKLKKLFSDCRTSFKLNPAAQIDLDAYLRRDDSHDYAALPGLVPDYLVGNVSAGGGVPYNKSDAFFTDFDKHHPEDYVLSSSELSLIIANRSSHDVRLYGTQWDHSPTPKDRSSSAGMSFVHLMVIPKDKVYNVVSLDDTSLIEEMISHFKRFWSQPDAVQRTARRIQHAVDLRALEVIKGLQQYPDQMTGVVFKAQFEAAMANVVQKSTDELLSRLKILAADAEFRKYSTDVHDWKTIPATAVMEVIREEKATNEHAASEN